nr:reverse transcriptase domain-containing protein [Tanacetum cinerariifolium]
MSRSPEPTSVFSRIRRDRSASPKHRHGDKRRREGDVFHRLGSRGKTTKVERWEIPTWFHMFNSTLIESARVWFDDLPLESIDSYDDLKKAFLTNYLQQKKHIKDSIDIHHIKQREGESTEDFVQRFKIESRHIKGAPKCMRISGFIQIEEIIKARELSHVIKELKQGKDQPKMAKTGETSRKDKAMAILMVQPLGEDNGVEGPMIIDAEIRGSLHTPLACGWRIILENTILLPVKIGDAEHSISTWMNFVVVRLPSPYNGIIGRPGDGQKTLCDLLRRNLDIFTWKPEDITGVPRHLAKHHLIVREGCSLVKQKKRSQEPERNKAIQEEVGKLMDAGIIKEIKMAKEDEEKTAFIISQGIFCYSKMSFGLKNAGATYQRQVDKAFQKKIGRNLEVYMDDLVIKSRMKHEIIRDIDETFKTLKEINMKLNPKKCTFGIEEGVFLGYKVNTKGINKESRKRSLDDGKGCKANVNIFCLSRPQGLEVNYTPMEKLILSRPEIIGRMQKCSIELGEYDIQYRPRTSVKGQILADFIVERPEDDPLDTSMEAKEELPDPWTLFTDGSSCVDAEYEALITGLRITKQIGIKNLQAHVDSRLVANQVNGSYIAKESGMVQYLEKHACRNKIRGRKGNTNRILLANNARGCKENNSRMPRLPSSPPCAKEPVKLTPIMSLWPFYKRRVGIAGSFPKGPERANKSLGEGIKVRLDERIKDWIEKSPRVLWAHRTMIKSSNWDTPFSLTYGTKVVIPTEIGMPTLRKTKKYVVRNNEALEINLDLLEERKEKAAIREARSKTKMEKYYNSKVRKKKLN